jgi:putative tryptophan/tyrosine transport system substrate-binding protein
MIGCRDLITLIGGAAAWPPAERAQQRVGCLFAGTPEATADEVAALRRGMSEPGFAQDRNVAVEYRWTYNEPGRAPELEPPPLSGGASWAILTAGF